MKNDWRFIPVTLTQKGFSLLEILIAVSILTTSLVVLLSLQGSSFLSSGRADRLTAATFLAQQKMAEVQIEIAKEMERNKFPSDVEKAGAFDEPFEEFRWKYTIQKVEIPVIDTGSSEETSEETSNVYVAAYLKNITEQISQSVREVQLTVLWGDKDRPEEDQPHMSVTTHIVKLK